MNIYNGHLMEAFTKEIPDNYHIIPEEYDMVAKLELAGKKETIVGLESSGTLSRWAKKKREKRKRKAMSKEKTLYRSKPS